MAHAILRGYVDSFGNSLPNYHYENLQRLYELRNSEPRSSGVVVDATTPIRANSILEQDPTSLKTSSKAVAMRPISKAL